MDGGRSYKWIAVWDEDGALARERALKELTAETPQNLLWGDYMDEKTYSTQHTTLSHVFHRKPPVRLAQMEAGDAETSSSVGLLSHVFHAGLARNASALVAPTYDQASKLYFGMSRTAFDTITSAKKWRESDAGAAWFVGAKSTTLIAFDA